MISERVQRHQHVLRGVALVMGLLALGVLLFAEEPATAPRPFALPDLIAPLAPGSVVADGFVLSSPHRGEEHDIQLQARRTRDGVTTVVELHILDRGRWTGIRESEHYGVAWELPRSTATRSESEAVAEHVAQVVRRNDTGPGVLVDALPLSHDSPVPRAANVLARVTGLRGVAVGLLLVLVTWALATLPRGAALVSLFLFAVGLALRLPHLDVPFVRDQDVQRVFTGHASLVDILTGVGLNDRHPPLYFVVLHLAQRFGQAELVVRMPAVICGALMGPALVTTAAALGRRVALAAVMALVPAVGFVFVAYSREVSSLPFYALVLVILATAVAKHHQTGSRGWGAVVIASLAVALLTFHTAVFTALALLCLLPSLGAAQARTRRAVLWGCLVGSPAVVHAAFTFVRDRGARAAAHAQPGVAWGDRTVRGIAEAMAALVATGIGPLVILLVVVASVVAARRRDVAVLVPLVMFVGAFAGIAALTPVARMQPYYVMGVLPLVLLSVALSVPPQARRASALVILVVAGAVAISGVPTVAAVGTLYVADERAAMPGFVDSIMRRGDRRIVTVAHYDMTLLAYYLGRASDVEVDFASLEPRDDGAVPLRATEFVLFPLVHTHVEDGALEANALQSLDAILAGGPALVVDRPTLGLSRVAARLARCQRLAERAEAALLRCSAEDPPAR